MGETTKAIVTEFGNCWLNSRGYYFFVMQVNGKKKNKFLHVARYISKYGPIPQGFVIHHKDGVSTNNEIENLESMTQRDHVRIHCGWIRSSKGIWTHKPCSICKMLKSISEFSTRKLRTGQSGSVPIDFCRACGNIRKKIWSDKNRDHVRNKANENYHRRVGNIR